VRRACLARTLSLCNEGIELRSRSIQKSVSVPIYLLIKADAVQIPLGNESVSLIIATPPYIGATRLHMRGYCTRDPDAHRARIALFLNEATRIVKPRGHVVLISSRKPVEKLRGARRIVFYVLQKQFSRGCWTLKQIGSELFLTHYVDVKAFPWWALPIRLYKALLSRYSKAGEIVAHIFSGSGNGGIAALTMKRRPILIDLYYHKQTKKRFNKILQSTRSKAFL